MQGKTRFASMRDKLALGMLSDAPLATFLEEYQKVSRISFCLDNDEPGRKAAEALMEKYYGLDYEVRRSCSRIITSGCSRRKHAAQQLSRNEKWRGKAY